jgi:hypothetical protein
MQYRIRNGALACAVAALALAPAAIVFTAATGGAAFAKGEGGGGNGGGNGNGGGSDGQGQSGKSYSSNDGGISAGKSASAPGKSGDRSAKAAPAARSSKDAKAGDAIKNGAVASELKGLNAAHANLQAYANAAPNSQVGRIAAYREAYLAFEETKAEHLEQEAAYLAALAEFAPEDTSKADLAAALEALQGLDDNGAPVTEDDVIAALQAINPDASEDEIADALAALDGAVEADNDLEGLDAELAEALAAASNGVELVPGTPAWDEFHALLKLDQELPVAGAAVVE